MPKIFLENAKLAILAAFCAKDHQLIVPPVPLASSLSHKISLVALCALRALYPYKGIVSTAQPLALHATELQTFAFLVCKTTAVFLLIMALVWVKISVLLVHMPTLHR